MRNVIDSLSQHPQIGVGGSFGGFFGSVFMTTPIFQFLSAFFGALIGLITLIGIIKRLYADTDKKSSSNS